MKRFHLFEFEDLPWFPKTIRDYGTDFLQFVANQFDFYKAIIPILEKGIKKGNGQIVDLASGGGGGWKKISSHLDKSNIDYQITFTDFYPNIPAFKALQALNPHKFKYSKESVNALNVPDNLKGLRTQFLSLHHFTPKQAQQILQNAVNNEQPIALFEGQARDLEHLIKFFLSPINVLLSTPFIRPFKLGRIVFTYIIPIVPLFVWWDGIVSVLRTYSVKEMEDMVNKLELSDTYVWDIRKIKNGQVTLQYIFGYKKDSNF